MIAVLLAVLFGLFGNVACAGPCTSPGGVAYLSAVNLATPSLNSGLNTTIPNGGSATLTWDAPGALSCAGTGFSTGASPGIGSVVISPTTTTTYSVNCGQNTASVTVTVSGTRIDAAAGVGVGGCTGSGTSVSPWNYLCMQNAINTAVAGDTVFLRGGNWVLNTTADANHVKIDKPITFTGAGSGNVFDTWGHINNPQPSPALCPTSGSSITCVSQAGTAFAFGNCTDNGVTGNTHTSTAIDGLSTNVLTELVPWAVGGTISGSGIPAGATIAAIAANGLSLTLDAAHPTTTSVTGNRLHALGFPWDCSGYVLVGSEQNNAPDVNCHDITISSILFDSSPSTAGGGVVGFLPNVACLGPVTFNDIRFISANPQVTGGSGEPQFNPANTQNVNIFNSAFIQPFQGAGLYSNSQLFQLNGGNGIGSNYAIRNNVLYQGQLNAIYLSNVQYSGNVQYEYNDGTGDMTVVGEPGAAYAGVQMGGPICAEAGASTTGNCNGDTNVSFTNNLFYAPGHSMQVGLGVNDPHTSGGIINPSITGNWVIASQADIDSCTWHLTAYEGSCGPGSPISQTINTAVDTACNESNNGTPFTVTNNSLLGTTDSYLDARGSQSSSSSQSPNDWTYCRVGNPWDGVTLMQIPIRVYGYNAQKNYLSSPNNHYNTNSNTISPIQTNNFCTPAIGTVTGCATTGFNTAPTVSFALGTLHGTTVDIVSPSFTAQYGAVQWLTSTSSTPPLSNDARWSSVNLGATPAVGSAPGSQANSYIPPMYLSGVAHGNTVYMWVMDKANQISAAASRVLP